MAPGAVNSPPNHLWRPCLPHFSSSCLAFGLEKGDYGQFLMGWWFLWSVCGMERSTQLLEDFSSYSVKQGADSVAGEDGAEELCVWLLSG